MVRNKWTPRLCRAAVVLLTTLALGSISLASATSVAAPRSGDLRLQLGSDRGTYAVGDPIRLRLTLSNIGSHPVGIILADAINDIQLTVGTTNGQVTRTKPQLLMVEENVVPHRFEPGRSIEIRHWPYDREDTSIEAWGYKLSAPGSYRITAHFFPERSGIHIASNTIDIVVHSR